MAIQRGALLKIRDWEISPSLSQDGILPPAVIVRTWYGFDSHAKLSVTHELSASPRQVTRHRLE